MDRNYWLSSGLYECKFLRENFSERFDIGASSYRKFLWEIETERALVNPRNVQNFARFLVIDKRQVS